MSFKINASLRIKLLRFAESGMGYQIVEAKISRAKTFFRGVLYNAELFMPDHEFLTRKVKSVTYEQILAEAEPDYLISDINPVQKDPDNDPHPAVKGRIFKRFTPYENDRRVSSDGGLLPGACAVPESTVGADIFSKYALPNFLTPKFILTITPESGALVQKTAAQALHQQPGGGELLIFKKGTAAGTVSSAPVR